MLRDGFAVPSGNEDLGPRRSVVQFADLGRRIDVTHDATECALPVEISGGAQP